MQSSFGRIDLGHNFPWNLHDVISGVSFGDAGERGSPTGAPVHRTAVEPVFKKKVMQNGEFRCNDSRFARYRSRLAGFLQICLENDRFYSLLDRRSRTGWS